MSAGRGFVSGGYFPGAPRRGATATIAPMAQGKRISSDIGEATLARIRALGAAARQARTRSGEGQAAAAARLGVHVQTIARIEAGEPGVAVGHVLGLLALYGISAALHGPDGEPV
jgi:HTH-type transcriptional regulator / antitoxin HipB